MLNITIIALSMIVIPIFLFITFMMFYTGIRDLKMWYKKDSDRFFTKGLKFRDNTIFHFIKVEEIISIKSETSDNRDYNITIRYKNNTEMIVLNEECYQILIRKWKNVNLKWWEFKI